MRVDIKRIIISTLVALSLVIGFLTVFTIQAPAAQAAGSCDGVPGGCISTQVINVGSSDGTGSGDGGFGGSGGSGSGSSTPPPKDTYYGSARCDRWFGTGQTTYPVQGDYAGQACVIYGLGRVYTQSGGEFYASCFAVDGKSATGITYVYLKGRTDTFGNIISYRCQYPATSWASDPIVLRSTTCSWNYSGDWYYSQNRGEIYNSGQFVADRGTRPGDPSAPYLSGNNLNSCNSNARDFIQFSAPFSKGYGYYRISAQYLQRNYTLMGYPAWTGNTNTYWVQGNTSVGSARQWYTYSCPSATETSVNHSDLPAQGSRIFQPALCPTTQWQCVVDGTLDLAGSHNDAEVMRNGEKVSLLMPRTVVTGNGIQNISLQYKLDVKDGSTPWNSGDQNASSQYFKMFASNKSTKENFGSWHNFNNDDRQRWVEYYWASNPGGNWSATENMRINGRFWAVKQDHLGGTVYYTYQNGSAQCPGMPIDSNKLSVLRSVSTK